MRKGIELLRGIAKSETKKVMIDGIIYDIEISYNKDNGDGEFTLSNGQKITVKALDARLFTTNLSDVIQSKAILIDQDGHYHGKLEGNKIIGVPFYWI